MLKENQTYQANKLLKAGVGAAYDLGKSLPKMQPQPAQQAKPQKSINVGQQFPNVSQATGADYFSNLGTTTVPYGGSTKYEQFHPGIDVANKIGTQIPFKTAGTVSEVVSGKKQGDSGFGNYVVVTDPQGAKHRYSHLHQSFVKPGQQVQAGQIGGLMGNTGQTYSMHGGTGSHLDYRIRDLYGKYINPFKYLKQQYVK